MFAGLLRRTDSHKLFERRQNFQGRTYTQRLRPAQTPAKTAIAVYAQAVSQTESSNTPITTGIRTLPMPIIALASFAATNGIILKTEQLPI
jgi:hypothetical protein